MNCNEAELIIHLYMDKEIDELGEKELFTHLAECNKCREEFRLLGRAQKAYNTSLEEFPERLDQRVIESLKKKETSGRRSIFTKRLPAYYLYAASIAIIIIVAIYFFREWEFARVREMDMNRISVMLEREDVQRVNFNMGTDRMPGIKVKGETNDPDLIGKEEIK